MNGFMYPSGSNNVKLKIISKSGSASGSFPNGAGFALSISVPDGYIAIASGLSCSTGTYFYSSCSSSISSDRKIVSGSFNGGVDHGTTTRAISGTLYAYCIPDKFKIIGE